MNKQELEKSIDLLDNAVERLVEVNDGMGATLIPDSVLEDLQQVISYMEREIRDGCDPAEDYLCYDEEEGWLTDDGS